MAENREVLETKINELLPSHLAKDLVHATDILLKDHPPDSVDAVFFFGRSYFDAEKQGIFTDAANLIKTGKARYILLADSEGERVGETTPRTANAGKTLWTDRLVKLGVNHSRILYSPHLTPEERGFHTQTESDAFLKISTEHGWKTAILLTQPHQIVRAMLGTVRTMNKEGYVFDVWCMTPQQTNWDKMVKGSQGMERKRRIEHIGDEVDRIFRYQAKGDLASFDELFTYLAKRDVNHHVS